MLIKTDEYKNLVDGYWQVAGYHRQLQVFYQFLDVQFKTQEYAVKLEPMRYSKLFTMSEDYNIDAVYPVYIWLPQWYGRFYVNSMSIPADMASEDCPLEQAKYLAFVWNWIGFNDPYVPDTTEPECWFGITKPETENASDRLENVAQIIWDHLRIKLTDEETSDGWLKGHYNDDKPKCSVSGWWLLKRLPLSQLADSYQVEQLLVRPICEKYNELSNAQ